MFGIWDVQDVGCLCLGCSMFGMWDVFGCGMIGMWDVWDVECLRCGMFGMWNVWDVG